MGHADVIVVGQGLAGTALAWQLLRRGRSVFVVDREPPVTSSRIAAGLVTPITGKRLAVSRELDELLPVATSFYRDIEARLGVAFFHALPCVRLFAYEIEQKQYAKSAAAFAGRVCDPDPPINGDWFDAPRGGFQMPAAARLDTAAYLTASRDHFAERGCYRRATVDPMNDIVVSADAVRVPRLEVSASKLVFCQGFDGAANPYFPDVTFNAAKGEILTLRIPGLAETRVMNRGVWLAPDGGDRWRAGATYSWDPLDCVPTAAGREEILTRLRAFLRLPVEVVGHAAAVRPILADRHPVIRWNAEFPRLGFFNGLGSKGSLLAPTFAATCADQCVGTTTPT
jgi:glycine/D-amino acid oxidase-like deaminating enzyme